MARTARKNSLAQAQRQFWNQYEALRQANTSISPGGLSVAYIYQEAKALLGSEGEPHV